MFRSTIIALFILFIASSTAFSQGRMSKEARLKEYTTRLQLTKEQVAIVDSVMTLADADVKKLFESESPDRAEMRKIMDRVNSQIETILDEEQKAEFAKMLAERKAKMEQRRKSMESNN